MTMKDIAGKDINLGDYVITTESGRIITARVTKINWRSEYISVEPIPSSTGGRRRPPIIKCLRRLSHNLYLLPKGDPLFTQIRGYWHNEGDFEIRQSPTSTYIHEKKL